MPSLREAEQCGAGWPSRVFEVAAWDKAQGAGQGVRKAQRRRLRATGGCEDAVMDPLVRYGVFVRPDPVTCAAVTRITAQLRAQYGLLSAGAFPPHATLAGSLPLARGSEALLAAISDVLLPAEAVEVRNAGLRRLDGGLVFAIDDDVAGSPTGPLADLAAAVSAAARPRLAHVPPGQLPADVHPPGTWIGHLSLASHDLVARPDLMEEVEAYVRELCVEYPTRFCADIVAVYCFEHPSWTGAWWRDMQWRHLRSWRLPHA
jgi:2'-5' RNA ligase superfamily